MTALCHNHEDPELWFHGSKHATARAKAICGRCRCAHTSHGEAAIFSTACF